MNFFLNNKDTDNNQDIYDYSFSNMYGFIIDKKNIKTIKITDKKVFNNFIKNCFNTSLFYLIITVLIPLLFLLITAKLNLNLNKIIISYQKSHKIIFTCFLFSFTAFIISYVMNCIICNFLSFLTMFICNTIFLCFVVYIINWKLDNTFMKTFLLTIFLILIFLYFTNYYKFITLSNLCWIMYFSSFFLLILSILFLLYQNIIMNKLTNINQFNLLIPSMFLGEKSEKNKFIFLMFDISLSILIFSILLLLINSKLEKIYIGQSNFDFKDIKWCVISIIYREIIDIIKKTFTNLIIGLQDS